MEAEAMEADAEAAHDAAMEIIHTASMGGGTSDKPPQDVATLKGSSEGVAQRHTSLASLSGVASVDESGCSPVSVFAGCGAAVAPPDAISLGPAQLSPHAGGEPPHGASMGGDGEMASTGTLPDAAIVASAVATSSKSSSTASSASASFSAYCAQPCVTADGRRPCPPPAALVLEASLEPSPIGSCNGSRNGSRNGSPAGPSPCSSPKRPLHMATYGQPTAVSSPPSPLRAASADSGGYTSNTADEHTAVATHLALSGRALAATTPLAGLASPASSLGGDDLPPLPPHLQRLINLPSPSAPPTAESHAPPTEDTGSAKGSAKGSAGEASAAEARRLMPPPPPRPALRIDASALPTILSEPNTPLVTPADDPPPSPPTPRMSPPSLPSPTPSSVLSPLSPSTPKRLSTSYPYPTSNGFVVPEEDDTLDGPTGLQILCEDARTEALRRTYPGLRHKHKGAHANGGGQAGDVSPQRRDRISERAFIEALARRVSAHFGKIGDAATGATNIAAMRAAKEAANAANAAARGHAAGTDAVAAAKASLAMHRPSQAPAPAPAALA